MIAYKIDTEQSQIVIRNSLGGEVKSDNIDYLLDFLLEPQPNQFRVFWDMDTEISPILAILDQNRLECLFQTTRTWLAPYSITYHPERSLIITKGVGKSLRVAYYNLSQFYPDIETASTEEAVKKGEELLAELASIGVEPRRLSSSIAIFDYIYDTIPLPNYRDMPHEVGELARESVNGGWMEAYQLGHWEQAWDYDIVSAYPSIAAKLLDHRYGTWAQDKECPSGAVYGFAYGEVKVATDISPIIFKDYYGHSYTPRGRWYDYLTKQEIDFLQEFDLGSFKISDAWWWIPKSKVYPLQLIMHKLFNQRMKSELLNRVVKGAMVGIYGRTLQEYPERFAPSYDPVWGSIIEAETRLKVARFIYENNVQTNLLHVSTDGVLLDKEVPLVSDNKFGSWKLDSTGAALVVSSGTLFYGKRRPHQLNYEKAIELVRAKPKANSWELPIKRRMKLGDTALYNAKLGKVKTIDTGFGLIFDHSRDFPKMPLTGKELLTEHFYSRPYRAGKLKNRPLAEKELDEE